MAKKTTYIDKTQQPLSTEVKGRLLAIFESIKQYDPELPALVHSLMYQVAKEQRAADSSELVTGELQKPLAITPVPKQKPAPAQQPAQETPALTTQ